MSSDSFTDFATKSKDLRRAQRLVHGGEIVGRALGALVSVLPWWLSHAPWWASPIFATVIGWAGGMLYGNYVSQVMIKTLKAKYPELKL